MATDSKQLARVLVLDGAQRAALAVTRALGKRGIPVFVADAESRTIASASRYCAGRIKHPSPIDAPDQYIENVARAVADYGITHVYPITDISTMLLAGKMERLLPAVLCAPNLEAYLSVSDKSTLVESAKRLGVPVPLTNIAMQRSEIIAAAHAIGFPIVLKPARSRFVLNGSVLSTSVKIARTPVELGELLARVPWVGHVSCLVQEFIPGHGAGIFTVFGKSGPLAWFAHRRIREMPPSGGVSVVCESATPDRALQDHAERLLRATGWLGPAMIEFRIGPNEKPYLMEINGRFWGSLQLPIDCGVDFPYLLLCAASDAEQLGPSTYPTGTRLRWLLRDFDNLVAQLRDRRASASRKLKALGAFIATSFDSNCRQELLRWDDPGPALRELVVYLSSLSRVRRVGR